MKATDSVELENLAIEHLRGAYHCSEAVLKALADHYDLDSDLLLRASNPFGGGIGDADNLCGAVAGAVMTIGSLLTPENRAPPAWPAGHVAKQFMERFEKEIGSTMCPDIRHNLHWKEAQKYCDAAVRAAVRIAYELIEDYFSTTNPT